MPDTPTPGARPAAGGTHPKVRVAGVLDRTLYEVELTGDPRDPVVGSKRIRGLVRQHLGETVLVTPVGPAYTVAADDVESLLALLSAHTKVTRVSDGAPTLVEHRAPGTAW